MYTDVVDIIHKSGALAFLAHPFEYRFDDTIGFINNLRKNVSLDGIECFHPSAENGNKIEILLEYARKKFHSWVAEVIFMVQKNQILILVLEQGY